MTIGQSTGILPYLRTSFLVATMIPCPGGYVGEVPVPLSMMAV